MNVPFVDLKSQTAKLQPEFEAALRYHLQNTDFILGKAVSDLETEFAAFCTSKHAIGVASGLDALKLSLRALNIGPGDEVILPANTFIATALAVSAVGAIPVLADIDPETYNLSIADIKNRLTSATRAVLPVHLYGLPADMDPILTFAREHRLSVIEDACQAHGARYKGRRAGSLGDIAAFSFYPGKNLGALGDGGMATTNDPLLAARIRLLRNYGSSVKYHHDEIGENSRLDTLQASFLRIKLKHLDEWNAARRNAATIYNKTLQGVGDLVLPTVAPYAEHIFHLYVVQTSRRDDLLTFLKQQGVDCLIHYPIPIHLQKTYSGRWQKGDFPITERAADRILSLPMFADISQEQIKAATSAIRKFFD
jgi:dTDP-4-amino-4,6-dideoxygalactose transaminase